MNKATETNAATKKMFSTKLLAMLAESPVHAGTGAELGTVDLPIQRERHTGYPTLHGSGIKGVLRDLAEQCSTEEVVRALFGSPRPERPGETELEAGAVIVSDARLLLLPVRTAGPPFAWVTSPLALERFRRDVAATGNAATFTVPKPSENEAAVAAAAAFPPGGIVLEEFEIARAATPIPADLVNVLRDLLPRSDEMKYWRDLLEKSLVVVGNDTFRDFATHATEVVTRVALEREKKTVAEHALWTEEYLPADSLLYAVVGIEKRRWQRTKAGGSGDAWIELQKVIESRSVAQFGGKETVGRGFIRVRLWPEVKQ